MPMADLSTPELGKLVERLRDFANRYVITGNSRSSAVALCNDAADALSRIAAERDEARGALGAVSAAIGSVRWMDPPDGGDVTLAEQVRRMRADLEAAERERDELKAEVERLRAGKITDAQGISWFESAFGVPLGDMPGRMDVEAMRARLRTPEESP